MNHALKYDPCFKVYMFLERTIFYSSCSTDEDLPKVLTKQAFIEQKIFSWEKFFPNKFKNKTFLVFKKYVSDWVPSPNFIHHPTSLMNGITQ
jgi:hypothetical protein